MTDIQLYLNDQMADLSDDSPIALSFQINNLADVKNQQGNTSNQFKLPLTQRNRQLLGFPDDIAFTTALPYRQIPAKVIQNGLEIIPYGIAELNGIEQDCNGFQDRFMFISISFYFETIHIYWCLTRFKVSD